MWNSTFISNTIYCWTRHTQSERVYVIYNLYFTYLVWTEPRYKRFKRSRPFVLIPGKNSGRRLIVAGYISAYCPRTGFRQHVRVNCIQYVWLNNSLITCLDDFQWFKIKVTQSIYIYHVTRSMKKHDDDDDFDDIVSTLSTSRCYDVMWYTGYFVRREEKSGHSLVRLFFFFLFEFFPRYD